MSGLTQNVSDRTLRAWLTAGPVDKGIGGGLIFFARESSARQGQATWILRVDSFPKLGHFGRRSR